MAKFLQVVLPNDSIRVKKLTPKRQYSYAVWCYQFDEYFVVSYHQTELNARLAANKLKKLPAGCKIDDAGIVLGRPIYS